MLTIEVRPTMILVSAAALIDIDGKVLLAQRPAGKPMAGLWEFPGGKIEADETPEITLIRELNEELGIDTSKSCLAPLSFVSHHYNARDDEAFHVLLMLCVCRRWKGKPQPLEGGAIKWVNPRQLRNYKMPAADIPLISALQDLL